MSNRVKELRKLAGLSQERLADMVDCNKSKISKLENEAQELTRTWMIKISNAIKSEGIDIVPADLLSDSDRFLSALEKECISIIRDLQDSQMDDFHVMIERFKR